MQRYCVFCEIVARREPAEILYESESVIVIRNRLRWVPVMLLSMPKEHRTQQELWGDMGEVGEAAVRMGAEHCPRGVPPALQLRVSTRCSRRSTPTSTSSGGSSWASTPEAPPAGSGDGAEPPQGGALRLEELPDARRRDLEGRARRPPP